MLRSLSRVARPSVRFFSSQHTALVYGGNGAMGQALVNTFNKGGWKTLCVDLVPNDQASSNIVLNKKGDARANAKQVSDYLNGNGFKVEAMINAAGAWAGGSMDQDTDAVFDAYESMCDINLSTAVAVSHLASQHLAPGGLLILTGAAPVLQGGTGFMMGYGVAKAGVHHIVKSMATPDGKLPENAKAICIVPTTIDTPSNREGMPDADFDAWTPADTIAACALQWSDPTAFPPVNTDTNKYYPAPALENGGFYTFRTELTGQEAMFKGSYDYINDEMVAFRDLSEQQ